MEDSLLAPKFYGGHCDLGYIMEDLGSHKNSVLLYGKETEVDASLVSPLLSKCPQDAEKALTLWMECLGRMHAVTIGKEKAYNEIRKRLGSRKETSRVFIANYLRNHLQTIEAVCEQIDFVPETQFYDELMMLADTIENPGPFLCYTHGDPCPDNCSLVGEDLVTAKAHVVSMYGAHRIPLMLKKVDQIFRQKVKNYHLTSSI